MKFENEKLTLNEYISYMYRQLKLFQDQCTWYVGNGSLPESLPLPEWHDQFDIFEQED